MLGRRGQHEIKGPLRNDPGFTFPLGDSCLLYSSYHISTWCCWFSGIVVVLVVALGPNCVGSSLRSVLDVRIQYVLHKFGSLKDFSESNSASKLCSGTLQ
jgi:hypothetical protein